VAKLQEVGEATGGQSYRQPKLQAAKAVASLGYRWPRLPMAKLQAAKLQAAAEATGSGRGCSQPELQSSKLYLVEATGSQGYRW